MRVSRKINAILRFRNPLFGDKEIDALKCVPKVDGRSAETQPSDDEPHTNTVIPRRPSILGLDKLGCQREGKNVDEKSADESTKGIDQQGAGNHEQNSKEKDGENFGTNELNSTNRQRENDEPPTNAMIPRRPSINPNRKMNFGLRTSEVDSKNQREGNIVEKRIAGIFIKDVINQQETGNIEQKINEDRCSKKKGSENFENIGLSAPNRKKENGDKKNGEDQRSKDDEETARQMSDSHATLRKRRGNVHSGKGTTTNQTTEIIEEQVDSRRNADQPNKNNLDVMVNVDPKNYQPNNFDESANKRRYDHDANPNQQQVRRCQYPETASTSSSNYPDINFDEFVDPDTDEFYLTQGLREDCVFYLQALGHKKTLFEEVMIVRHVCGLIIPP